jgi:hypothetical protein
MLFIVVKNSPQGDKILIRFWGEGQPLGDCVFQHGRDSWVKQGVVIALIHLIGLVTEQAQGERVFKV